MIEVVILTHGALAGELLRSAGTILGAPPRFTAVSLDWGDTFETARRTAERALAGLDPEAEVLILTDMFGGTPHNVAASLRRPGRIAVVSGVNLPMVVRLGCPGATDRGLAELVPWIRDKGRKSIRSGARAAVAEGCGGGGEER